MLPFQRLLSPNNNHFQFLPGNLTNKTYTNLTRHTKICTVSYLFSKNVVDEKSFTVILTLQWKVKIYKTYLHCSITASISQC